MRRLISILLTVCILSVSLMNVAYASESVVFNDGGTEERVTQLKQLGLFDLYTEGGAFFDETATVKRSEAAAALVKLFGYDSGMAVDVADIFYDVPDYYEYAESIGIAVGAGLMVGVGNGLFEPEEGIMPEHFIKTMVTALGYGWKAEVTGYPAGYINVANELKLLDGVTFNMNEPLTRQSMVHIIYNSLDTPVSIITGMGNGYADFKVDEDVTLLSYYHDIYTDEGFVQSNNSISLESEYEPNNERIIISGEELHINGNTEIFSYLGHRVKYYYKQAKNEEKKELIAFALTDSEAVVTLYPADIIKADASKVVAESKNGREKTYTINSGADVIYNGKLITSGIDGYIGDFNGSLQLIDSDDARGYDFVIIFDYVYDEVVAVDAAKNEIYCKTCEIEFDKAEYTSIADIKGNLRTVEDVKKGDVVAVAESLDKKFLKVVLMTDTQAVMVKTKSDDGVGDANNNFYKYSKDLSDGMKALLKLNTICSITLNEMGEVVWVSTNADVLILGYLIDVRDKVGQFGEYDASARILSVDGSVNRYMCADSFKIDGEKVEIRNIKSTLASIKSNLRLSSDGATSQVVAYRLTEDGLLKELQTANPVGGTLFKKFANSELSIKNHGSNTGMFNEIGYPIAKSVPIFRVPKENQEACEDKYFAVTHYLDDGGPKNSDNEKYSMEGYVEKPNDVLSAAMVMYKTATAEIPLNTKLFLVEDVLQVLDEEGVACGKVCGYWGDGYAEIMLDPEVVVPTELTKGDVCVFNIDMTGTATMLGHVYDYETDTVLAPYSTPVTEREITMTHVYNVPDDPSFVEAYAGTTGFATGNPTDERFVLNFVVLNDNKVVTFDRDTEDISRGRPAVMLDYQSDTSGTKYTKVLVRYYHNYPMNYIIYK